MEVSEVRIKLAGDRDDKLRAFCTLTFDNCFVVRDIKIIRGTRGPFVAMPSRKLTDLCPKCRGKNHLRARFCNECGHRLSPDRAARDATGRAKLHADIAHPIHREYRGYLEGIILHAYGGELERSKQPGYQPPADVLHDAGEDYFDDGEPPEAGRTPPPAKPDDHSFGEGILP
ncbi:MAG: stage V sporulation protein G [Planctomycetes bacterium]|nr:stage V sporulation protein G [Planctomycetota bacterium]